MYDLARPDSEALLAVAGKYQTLHAWRVAHAANGTIVERDEARKLARAFPGALRELDTLSLDEMARRAEALTAAARAAKHGATLGNLADWMTWICAYHALSRVALWIKAELGAGTCAARSSNPSRRFEGRQEEWAELARRASHANGVEVGAQFARTLLRPPRGRVSAAVLSELCERLNARPEAVTACLFPRRSSHHAS